MPLSAVPALESSRPLSSRTNSRFSRSGAGSALTLEALAPGGFVHRRAVAQGLPPLAVVRIPGDGPGDPVLPADLVAPAELVADLRRVEQVAAVVPGTVGDDRLQRLGLAGVLEHRVGDLRDRLLDSGADVVGLARAAAVEHELDRAAVVEHVQPFALVGGRGVERQRLVV